MWTYDQYQTYTIHVWFSLCTYDQYQIYVHHCIHVICERLILYSMTSRIVLGQCGHGWHNSRLLPTHRDRETERGWGTIIIITIILASTILYTLYVFHKHYTKSEKGKRTNENANGGPSILYVLFHIFRYLVLSLQRT